MRTSTYISWMMMRQRCLNPKRANYKYYGGRGITICSEWNKYAAFIADMGERPPGTSLERRRNDEGYDKTNCVWATQYTQTRNYACNIPVTIDGKTACLKDLARDVNIPYTTVLHRINRGWDAIRALTTVGVRR